MAKILTLDEMLEVLQAESLPCAEGFKMTLEAVGTRMAQELAAHLGITCRPAVSEGLTFAGTCAAFSPVHVTDQCPDALKHLDPGCGWD
jgi:hypothetical protein